MVPLQMFCADFQMHIHVHSCQLFQDLVGAFFAVSQLIMYEVSDRTGLIMYEVVDRTDLCSLQVQFHWCSFSGCPIFTDQCQHMLQLMAT
jgi:hypothetical protein